MSRPYAERADEASLRSRQSKEADELRERFGVSCADSVAYGGSMPDTELFDRFHSLRW